MAGALRGITIELGGDTTKLGKALEDVNKKSKTLQSELKGVNSLLKHDPSNTTLLAQKQELLTKAIGETKNKLETLKTAQQQAQAQFERGEITEEQYRDLQREIAATEQKLEGLTGELKEFGSVGAQKAEQVAQKISEVGEKMQDVGGKVESFGKSFSVISAGAGAVLTGSTMAAVDFEDAMAKLHTIADTSAVSLDDLSVQILDLSNQTGISATDIANATYDAISAGQSTADAVNFVSNATSLARAGFADTGASLDLLTTIMNAYGMEASEVGDVSDMLIQIQNKGKTTVAQLASAMGKVIPTANSMNVGLEQLGAGYAIMTSKGIATAETTTYMNAMLNELGKGGTKVSDILKEKTGKSFQTLMGEGKSLGDVLGILQDHATKSGQGFNDLWSSSEAGKAAITLLSDGVDGFNSSVSGMNESVGATSTALEKLNTPSQKAREALTQLKNSGISLGQSILSSLAPTIDKISKAIKKYTERFNELSPATKKSIVTVLGVTAAIGPLLIAVGKIISLIGQVLTFAPKIVSFIKTLNATLSLSPWGAVAVAIGLVVAGLIAYHSTTKDTQTDTEIMCDKMDELNSKISENAKAYNDAKKARLESMQGTESEFGHYQNLVTELGKITDANGNVIAGYETRAATITGILSEALGEEITTDQLVAQGKQTIIDKINNLILTKKAEVQLQANEQAYADAVQKSTGAVNDYMTAKANAKKVDDELVVAKEELTRVEQENQHLLQRGTDGAIASYYAITADARAKVDDLTAQQTENNKAVSEAQSVYLGYQNTIQNYEGLSSAIISGDANQINLAMSNLVNGFITAENGTRASLANQVNNAETMLSNLEQAFAEGAPGVSQQMVDNARDLVERSTAEYRKLVGESGAIGLESVAELERGMRSKSGELQSAGQELGEQVTSGLESQQGPTREAALELARQAKSGAESVDTTESGVAFGRNLTSGILANSEFVNSSAVELMNQAKAGAESVDTTSTGATLGQNFAIGLSGQQGSVWSAGVGLGFQAQSGSASVDTTSSGNKLGQGVATGLNAQQGAARSAGSSVGTQAKSGVDSVETTSSGNKLGQGVATGLNAQQGPVRSAGVTVANQGKSGLSSVDTTSAGSNFGQGFINGILSKIGSVWNAAISLAQKALAAVKSGIQEGSPSRLTKKSGGFFGEGFAIGIKKSIPKVRNSVRLLVADTKEALTGRDGFDIHSPSRYMSDEVGAQLVAGLVKGVKDNKDNAKKSAQELAKLYISETETALKKRSEWHEITIGDEIYLWEQLLKECAKGSDEYKDVELKLIEAHESYVDSQRSLGNMSIQAEASYWFNLTKTCEQGSVMYKSAVKNHESAVTEYEENRVSDLESYISQKQEYREIEVNDEIQMWKKLLTELEKGSNDYKDAEINLFDTYARMVDEKRETNEMSLQDEMAFWLNMSATCEEGSVLYKYIRERYGKAVREYDETFVESHAEHVDELREKNEMSLGDEVEYWKKLIKSGAYHVKNYSKILDKLTAAKKELNAEMKQLDADYAESVKDVKENLIDSIQAVTDEYDKAVEDRRKSIVSSMGLFDAFKADADVDKYTLAYNLETQVDALKEWDSVLTSLSNRKGLKGSELLSDLQEMDVSSIETLKNINSMSDSELQNYIRLYNEKNRIATSRAVAESQALKAESDAQIRQLISDANTQLNELEKTYVANLKELGVTTADKSVRIGRDIVAGLKSGIVAETPAFQEYLKGFFNNIVTTAKNSLKIYSPSRIFANVIGKQIPAGIALGITNNSDIANKAVRDMATDLTKEASILNGATISRKLDATFSASLGNGRTLADVMDTMIECSNKIYERLNRLQIVLDSGTLVGETIDKIDAGLANRQILTARGL